MSCRLVVLFLCLAFSAHFSVKAQSAPTADPFNPRIERLPQYSSGLDLKAIYSDLASSKPTKGEFETTEEFHARVQRETAAPVLGKLDKSGYFPFQIKNGTGEVLYDADRQTLTVAIALDPGAEDHHIRSDKMALTVQSKMSQDKYEANNAYGGRITVTRISRTSYRIAFANQRKFGVSRYLDSTKRKLGYTDLVKDDVLAVDAIVIQLGMDVPTARRVKANLKILAVVRLIGPYTYDGQDYFPARFNDPTEIISKGYFLNTRLEELWLYDETTGEILLRKRAQ